MKKSSATTLILTLMMTNGIKAYSALDNNTQKQVTEKVIKDCNTSYQHLQVRQRSIEKHPIPLLLKYKRNSDIYKKAFALKLQEFNNFLNKKISLRILYTSTVRPRDLETNNLMIETEKFKKSCVAQYTDLNNFSNWILSDEKDNRAQKENFEKYLKEVK